MLTVGKILRTARIKRQMTVPQIARKVGISQRYVGFLEGDRPSHFSERLFDKFCKVLKIRAPHKTELDKQRKILNKRVLKVTRSYAKAAKK